MDDKQAKRERKQLRNAKRMQMDAADTNDKRKYISKEFKKAFRRVKRSEKQNLKKDLKDEYGI